MPWPPTPVSSLPAYTGVVNVNVAVFLILRGIAIVGWDSAVGIATQYGLDRPGNPVGGNFSCAHPDWPWGPPILLYNGYQMFFGGKVARA